MLLTPTMEYLTPKRSIVNAENSIVNKIINIVWMTINIINVDVMVLTPYHLIYHRYYKTLLFLLIIKLSDKHISVITQMN